MKKILHITNWYPNQWHDLEGIFIQEQYKIFSEVTDSHLIHVQVRESNRLIAYKHIKYSSIEEGYYICTKIKSTKIIELLTTILLLCILMKSQYKKYNILHFHIAYPLLSYYSWWKKIIKKPILISEHWSAYHFNFYMPWDTKKLERIKNIFKQYIPLITVSKALLEDIQKFSKSNDFSSTVIPNVLSKSYHSRDNVSNDIPIFFIVNIWRKIKNPFCMLEAFSTLAQKGEKFELHIGGYGELLEDMKFFVKSNNLEKVILFLGKMDSKEIEYKLNACDAYLFSSKYETFSVACADALTCGCPLIGPPISSILEYTDLEDIIIINKDSVEEWENKLKYFIDNKNSFDHKKIASKADNYFSNKKIEDLYIGLINENY